jgi:hypothetical protein
MYVLQRKIPHFLLFFPDLKTLPRNAKKNTKTMYIFSYMYRLKGLEDFLFGNGTHCRGFDNSENGYSQHGALRPPVFMQPGWEKWPFLVHLQSGIAVTLFIKNSMIKCR